MVKKSKKAKEKRTQSVRKRNDSSKLKRTRRRSLTAKAKTNLKPKKTLFKETHYPLFRKRNGSIKLRVPGPGPINTFDQEHSKKEVISKRLALESNEKAWAPQPRSV